MAFEPESSRTPTDIGEIVVNLRDPDGTNPKRGGDFEITVLDQAGNGMRRPKGDILVKGNAAVKSAGAAFLDAVRAQAEAEMLP